MGMSIEMTGGSRKLHNEELCNYVYSLLDIIRIIKSRRMRWVGHVVHVGEFRNVHKILVGKPEGKSLLALTIFCYVFLSIPALRYFSE